jgi:hypothetical protein
MARLCAATALSVIPAVYTQQASMPPIIQEARTLLTRAEASSAGGAERKQALSDAADRFERLAGSGLPAGLLKELRQAATTLRQEARVSRPKGSAFSAAPFMKLLERAASESTTAPLEFQGSFSQSRIAEPVYGGHGSAMGPAGRCSIDRFERFSRNV